jgi:hypothetical protein
MDPLDEMREALKPMIERGIAVGVLKTPATATPQRRL